MYIPYIPYMCLPTCTTACIHVYTHVYIRKMGFPLQAHDLQFDFPFYGHTINLVAVTTGGTYVRMPLCVHVVGVVMAM